MARHYVYQFYAELEDFSPKIWRRFEIVGSKTMAELGYSLMVLFEMTANHLFCITDDRQKSFKEHLKKTYSDEEIKGFLEKYDMNELGANAKYGIDFGEERWAAPNEKIYDADQFTIHNASYGKG